MYVFQVMEIVSMHAPIQLEAIFAHVGMIIYVCK